MDYRELMNFFGEGVSMSEISLIDADGKLSPRLNMTSRRESEFLFGIAEYFMRHGEQERALDFYLKADSELTRRMEHRAGPSADTLYLSFLTRSRVSQILDCDDHTRDELFRKAVGAYSARLGGDEIDDSTIYLRLADLFRESGHEAAADRFVEQSRRCFDLAARIYNLPEADDLRPHTQELHEDFVPL